MRNIDFTDGGVDSPGQLGGGIQLSGSGRLTLANVAVYGNVAESGGASACLPMPAPRMCCCSKV